MVMFGGGLRSTCAKISCQAGARADIQLEMDGTFRICDDTDRTPDESDMRKGGVAGRLIFSDAFPAEITRDG